MELKAKLEYPYTFEQKRDFIFSQNHQNGYEINFVENNLEAWGYTDEELLINAKQSKQEENTSKAQGAVESGYVEFKEAQFETNAQTVGDLTATMLLMQASGLENYDWLSKDDKIVSLSLEDFATLGGLIAQYKNNVWSNKYLDFKEQIENAQTLEEVEAIVIDYFEEN